MTRLLSKYAIRDREAGNLIEQFYTYEQALEALLNYEKADKAGGVYTPDFYEIVRLDWKGEVKEVCQ